MWVKFYGELDLNGKLRILKRDKFKKFFLETELEKFSRKENLIVSITDNKVMDRIYQLPKLKRKQIEIALSQKLKKDLEFIVDISETEWIYSIFPKDNGYRVLVSIIKKVDFQTLPKFKALTTTTQVIASLLNNRKKDTFMLVHSFLDDYLIFVFKDGIIDYVRGFKAESSVDESIDLTLEYYKEQRKIDIKTVVYSGSSHLIAESRKEIKPITSYIDLGVKDPKFLIPFSLSQVKVPFFYSYKFFKPVYVSVPISLLFFLGAFYNYVQESSLSKELNVLKRKEQVIQKNLNSLRFKLHEIDYQVEEIRKKIDNPKLQFVLSLKEPQIPQFINSLRSILISTNSYVLLLKGEGNHITLSTITMCKNISRPVEFHRLINLLRINKFIVDVKLIEAEKFDDRNIVTATFNVKIKEQPFLRE